MSDDPLSVALECAARGWHVFPCNSGKKPLTKNGFKDATTDPERVRYFWERKPKAAVGVATGASNLVVIDLDVKGEANGLDEWHEIVSAAGGGLEDTTLVETPSGGMHVYYRANGHKVGSTASKLAPGIDTRAEGGYVIAAGSPGYLYVDGHGPEALKTLPAILGEKLAYAAKSAPLIPEAALGIPEGRRDSTLASLAGTMRRRGMGGEAILAALHAENKAHCKPPLPDKDVERIAASVARYEPSAPAARQTPVGKPEPITCLPAVNFGDLLDETPERPEYVWYGYLAKGAITELAAKPKVGKTRLSLEIVRSVLHGETMLGHATFRCPVLYMTEQGHGSFITQTRASHLHDSRDGFHVLLRGPVRRLGWDEVGELAFEYVKEHGIGLVVVDTLSEWASLRGDDENSAGAAMAAMAPLRTIADAGCAVLAVRHERKGVGDVGESARGSSAFGGGMDILMALRRTKGRGHETRRELFAVGRFDDAPPVLTMEYDLGRGAYSLVMEGESVRKQEVELKILEVLPDMEGWALTVAEIRERIDVGDNTARRALKDLCDRGVIRHGSHPREDGHGRHTVYWHEGV